MSSPKPTRTQGDLAEMLELLLDKGVVINADIVVTIGDTELLGIQLRAAIASFETADKYGLEFPAGTDLNNQKEEKEKTTSDREKRKDKNKNSNKSVSNPELET